jgi:integrase
MASIIKRANRPKPWLVFWREPGTKQQKAQAFETKHEAEDFRDTVSPNTAAFHEWAVARLTEAFGLTPIQNLRAEQIEEWQSKLLEERKLSRRSLQHLRVALGTILADARRKKVLYANPMETVERFKVPRQELRCLKVEQLGALCEQAGRLYGVLFLTQALCGLRTAEVLGIQWPDLDFEGGRLFVRRQVVWRRKKDCKAGEPRWAFAEPKSEAGKRVVELHSGLAPFLQAHRERQNGGPNPHALVFCTSEGTPLDGRNVRRRHFQPALGALGLTGIRPHDFRRTFIALHVEAGTHPKLVQERVGHSDIRLTMDTYAELAGRWPCRRSRPPGSTASRRRRCPSRAVLGQH